MTQRVALLPEHFNWGGGFDFLRHILNGLSSISVQYQLEVSLAVRSDLAESESYLQFRDYLSQSSCLSLTTFVYQSVHTDLTLLLSKHQIDIVLPVNADLGANFPVPWVSYIPDFQHKYLFSNFTEHECFTRETAFAARLRDCKTMLVNAEAVKADILKFYPWVNDKRIFVLPFSPHPLAEWFDLNPVPVQEKYAIGSRYFILCNQFWLHKDHRTAFKAFAALAQQDLQLVCTGATADYRSPGYLNELLQLADELGIRKQLVLLGHIPKRDQIALVRGALALIQPTLFEGGPGGGAVYDAVSVGVPVVLSDIKVNREVDAEELIFFKAGDAAELRTALQAWLNPNPRPAVETLIRRGNANKQQLGEKLYNIIQQTLKQYAS